MYFVIIQSDTGILIMQMQIPEMIEKLFVIQMTASPHVVVLVAVILQCSANAHHICVYFMH